MAGSWTWTDAAIFVGAIAALRLAMFSLLTTAFFRMIPEDERCPLCDGETQAVERCGVWRVLCPGLRNRRSWCVNCEWEGILRRSDAWLGREKERRRAWRQANDLRARVQARSRSPGGWRKRTKHQ